MLSFGFVFNEADKCVYRKFNDKGNGIIICFYVNDMLIFGISLEQVEMTKEFLSSSFSMKDLGEADVILGIKIIKHNTGLMLNQSHYIEKIYKHFDMFDKSPISTPMDACEKLLPYKGEAISQLEYSKIIGSLMYAMTCTRPYIAFVVERLSRLTQNSGPFHWKAVRRVLR